MIKQQTNWVKNKIKQDKWNSIKTTLQLYLIDLYRYF